MHAPEVLFEQAKNGNKEAFGALYHEYLTPVFRFIYYRVGNKATAEDICQTVFLHCFEALKNNPPRNQNPLAYFLASARNATIDHWRKKKETLIGDPTLTFEAQADTRPTAHELIIHEEDVTTLYRWLKELNDEQQEVLIMKFVNDLPNDTIAATLNKSEQAVRQIQSRGLRKLRLIATTTV